MKGIDKMETKEILEKIAGQLTGINADDLTTAEKNIMKILSQTKYWQK